MKKKITWEDLKTPEDVFDYAFDRDKMDKKIKDQYSDDNCICQAHRINSECVRHGTKKD